MPRKKSGEDLRAYEAFEFWFFMHPRSYDKVADHFKVSSRIVREWHAKFRWEERAQEREGKIKAQLADKSDAEFIKARANIIAVGRATIARYAARLLKKPEDRAAQGVTQYEPTASDALRAAQMEILLAGGATSRTDITIGQGFVTAFLAMVGAVLRREIPQSCPHCQHPLRELPERISQKLLEASNNLSSEGKAAGNGLPSAPIQGSIGRGDSPDEAGPE